MNMVDNKNATANLDPHQSDDVMTCMTIFTNYVVIDSKWVYGVFQ